MSQKKCPSCSTLSPAQTKFCPECGSPMSKKAVEKAKTTKKNPTRDTLVIVGLLVVVAIGYFIINKPQSIPKPPQQQAVDPEHESMASTLGELPNDYNSLIQIGNQTMDEGNFPMAAECYKRALNIKGDSPNVRTDYGACLHGMGLPERAIQEFMTVVNDYPQHTIANFNLGIVYYSESQIDSAKTYFNKFLSIESTGATADAARKYLEELK